jgi:putative DNA primase/helicase
VFAATVNETEFLVDPTGNTRWWTIPITHVNFKHGIDMQQVFAQMAVDFHRGEQWWLTKAEEACLESMNKDHRSVSVIRERVLQVIDLKRVNDEKLPAMSTIELMERAGIKSPTNAQCKECTGILREYLGASKKINGIQKWRIPLREVNLTDVTPGGDDDSMF